MSSTIADTCYLRPGEFAEAFFGANTRANRHRLYRMIDRGEIGCIRIGDRRDRLIPRSEIDRLAVEAERARQARAVSRVARSRPA